MAPYNVVGSYQMPPYAWQVDAVCPAKYCHTHLADYNFLESAHNMKYD
jgi:hypothetical protein